jgi:hypothetical protein
MRHLAPSQAAPEPQRAHQTPHQQAQQEALTDSPVLAVGVSHTPSARTASVPRAADHGTSARYSLPQ